MNRNRPSWRWLLAGVVITVVVAAAAGLVIRGVYADPTAPEAALAGLPSATAAPDQEPGDGRVQLAPDARNHPDALQVLAVLQRQFDAINTGNYNAWTTTVMADKLKDLPRQKWHDDYATTKDGSIVVHRIDPGASGGLVVLVTFTSTQSIDRAPPDFPYSCIHWRMMYPITQERGDALVDTVRPANVLRGRCGI